MLFLVVGPSGVGKDTLIDGARAELAQSQTRGASPEHNHGAGAFDPMPHFAFAQRTITRPAEAGGEAHEAVTVEEFDALDAADAFAVSWGAHETRYGIRHEQLAPLHTGRNVLVNASRRAVGRFCTLSRHTTVLSVTAPPEVVRQRLEARGREDAAAVAARMAREAPAERLAPTIEIANDGPEDVGVARFVAALMGAARFVLPTVALPLALGREPLLILHEDALVVRAWALKGQPRATVRAGEKEATVRLLLGSGAPFEPRRAALNARALKLLGSAPGAPVLVSRATLPRSRDALRRKVAGATLTAAEIEAIGSDIITGRYGDGEIAGFLTAAAKHLSTAEVTALTAVRAALLPRLHWDAPVVADKHALGGVPGSRISMVVVPIVAAYGLPIPKASARAITSAAGTADVMECVAQVELDAAQLQEAVRQAGGVIVANTELSQSPLDDVMNAINRPLGLRSGPFDVSSILSKKLALGATHVVLDIPVGPYAKVRSRQEAETLAQLFRIVGGGLGMLVYPVVSDGRDPIGFGIGPALELVDVEAVLDNAPHASQALREKSLMFAGLALEFSPDVAPGQGRALAQELLQSGAARAQFDAIRAAQGALPTVTPGLFREAVSAPRSGRVAAIDGFRLAGIARAAGAPIDKGAGVQLFVQRGQDVTAGAPLAEIVASTADAVEGALAEVPSDLFSLV